EREVGGGPVFEVEVGVVATARERYLEQAAAERRVDERARGRADGGEQGVTGVAIVRVARNPRMLASRRPPGGRGRPCSPARRCRCWSALRARAAAGAPSRPGRGGRGSPCRRCAPRLDRTNGPRAAGTRARRSACPG